LRPYILPYFIVYSSRNYWMASYNYETCTDIRCMSLYLEFSKCRSYAFSYYNLRSYYYSCTLAACWACNASALAFPRCRKSLIAAWSYAGNSVMNSTTALFLIINSNSCYNNPYSSSS
jgi:hypothetical protein